MKFALAFSALAAAANNQAPVISLDLGVPNRLPYAGSAAHQHFHGGSTAHIKSAPQNSFADECAVNTAGVDNECKEPVATAYDHHDGDISSKIFTSYTLFVDSVPMQNPTHEDSPRGTYNAAGLVSGPGSGRINLSERGEWIMKYDVKDADGNNAESITFALILTDEIKPSAGTSGARTFELCKDQVYEALPQQKTTDAYDGELTEQNSIMEVRITHPGQTTKLWGKDEANKDDYHVINRDLYKGIDSKLELSYEVESHDFADIFGTGNKNNVRLTTGSITLEDTTAPTIKQGTATVWQCGYEPDAASYRFPTAEAYDDCYDDWNLLGKHDVAITINGSPIDSGKYTGAKDYTAAAKALFGSDNASAAHSKQQTLTLKYNVADQFNNAATEATISVLLEDTIAPTLYITKKVDHATGGTVGTDTCHENSATAESWSGNNMGDKTLAHCKIAVDGESKMYKHGSQEAAVHTTIPIDTTNPTDPMASETKIQHSAGYAADYVFVQQLMQEGTGYRCSDQCSDTTTTVEWKASDCADGANTEFNMLVPGTYFLKYTCTDEKKIATTACRTFVNVDKTRPVITILEAANHNDGTWHVEASRDNNYVDAGATCSDMVDGNISQDVEVSGDVVNMAAVGTYSINYNCLDSAGQQAYPATRVVIVEDKTCPTCTVPGGDEVITVEASFPYAEETSTCTDTLDGLIGDATIYGKVDVEKTGMYVLTYSVTDKNGNGADPAQCTAANANHRSATHFTKTVVVEDTMVPIISLKYKGNKLMAESTTSSVNGWVIGAVASAVSGVALLGYAATRKATVATSVPV